MQSSSKAILITGASRRLGLAMAKKCIQLGYKVVLHYRTKHNEFESLLNSETQLKSNIFPIQQELTENPELFINKVRSFPVKLVGLVNNASIFTEGNLNDFLHFENILKINTFIPLQLSTSFYNNVKNGWIINITDAMCNHSNIRYQNYRLSKQFLELITKQQALLFAPKIRVNCIAPGAMIPAPDEKTYFKKLNRKIPLKKTGDITSLLSAFSFLIETPYITGEIIRIDGGWNNT